MPTAEVRIKTRGHRKVRVGVVTSDRMQKTIVVRVTRVVRHPLYQRVIKQRNSFKVHDEQDQAKLGDVVRIVETRPLSKDKRWRLVEVVTRASTVPPVPEVESEQRHSAKLAGPQTEESPRVERGS